jgi:LPXTG-motif cell wall-anchored protein
MKKFALSLIVAAAAIFGTGVAAQAQPPYPPAAEVSPIKTAGPGDRFTVNVKGCTPNAAKKDVAFVFRGQDQNNLCSDVKGNSNALTDGTGTSSATFVAPMAAGTYTGTATGTDGFRVTFSVTVAAAPPVAAAPVVPVGGLPVTGSDGTSTMTMMAFGILALGGGLLVVSQMRRRQIVPA